MKRNPEADEINNEDLEAAADFFERLVAKETDNDCPR